METARALTPVDDDELPTFGSSLESYKAPAALTDVSSALHLGDGEPDESGIGGIPPPFTPSIKKTLDKPAVDAGFEPVPLPSGIDVSLLKSRLDGKKKIKYVFSGTRTRKYFDGRYLEMHF